MTTDHSQAATFRGYYNSVLLWLLLAASYYFAANLGLMLAFEQANTSPVWPPTGIAIAALLFFGQRAWPGVFLGAFLVNYLTGLPAAVVGAIALGNTLEALVASYLILRFTAQYPFSNVSNVFKFVFIVMLATSLSAFIGVISLVSGDIVNADKFWLLWSTWWLGDLVGGLVITPLLLTWSRPLQVTTQLSPIWLSLLLLVVTLLCGGLVFGEWSIFAGAHYPVSFLCLPVAIWAAYKFRQSGATLFIIVLSVVAIIATLNGFGPFAVASVNESLLLLQGFIGVLVITTLTLAANIDEKVRAELRLNDAQLQLERRVQQRTIALSDANTAQKAEVEKHERTVEALRSLLSATALSTDEKFFRTCVRDLAQIYAVRYVVIGTFVDDSFGRFRTHAVWAGENFLENLEYQVDAAEHRDVLQHSMECSAGGAARQYPDNEFISRMGIDSCLGAPIISPSNQLLGMVVIMHDAPMASHDWAGPMLGILANRVALELERNDSEEELKLAASVFNEIVEAIMVTDSSGNILRVNPAFTRITGYDALEVVGINPRFLKSGHHDNSFYEEFWRVLLDKGTWQGEIWERRLNGEVFPVWQTISAVYDKDGEIIQFISIFSDITEKKLSEERIFHLAHYDSLTTLPNRSAFHEQLERSLLVAGRQGLRMALLFVDIDHFKLINDASGHVAGDNLLKHVAQCLSEQVRAEDVVARLGGDEFTILLSEIKVNQDAALVAEKILTAISQPFIHQQTEVVVTASIGISIFPDDGTDASVILKNADAAMFRAKEQGRNNYQFFTAEMNTRALERLSLESALRKALERDEFLLHYQPQVSLESGEIVGVEALIRWQHPSQGLISPAVFIPVAEESGLIVPIGEWVMRTACLQQKQWLQSGLPAVRMAVNLSARQLLRRQLVQTVKSVINDTGIDPQFLELELTESMIMDKRDETIQSMNVLREMGVHLAIDDFGTGYSSMSYLKRFPISKLKIDQSFVRDIAHDPDDAAIVTATIALGHGLNLVVIAEGVETEEQLQFLKSKGCEQMQGYYFSRPLSAEDVTVLLTEGNKLELNKVCF